MPSLRSFVDMTEDSGQLLAPGLRAGAVQRKHASPVFERNCSARSQLLAGTAETYPPDTYFGVEAEC